MTRLEIFQQVYGTDYVFTVKELERLRQVTELIVRECAGLNFRELGLSGSSSFDVGRMIKQHFGVEE